MKKNQKNVVNKQLILVCGVSGSGKTWACQQVRDKFLYIPQELYWRNDDHIPAIIRASTITTRPMLTECPFGERVMREELEKRGIEVLPFFIVEHPDVVARRYADRERKQLPKAAYTRATTIMNRVQEWKAPYGTSEEVLKMLQSL